MIKYVIFDFDGTITDSVSMWSRLFKQTLEKYGVVVTEGDVRQKALGKRYGIVDLGLSKDKVDEFYTKMAEENKEEILNTPIISGVKKALSRLQKNGYNLSINTSSDAVKVNNLIRNHNLAVFDVVVGGYDVVNLKPDPESIFKIMDFYGDNNVESYLIIGDSDKDILAGKNAGIKTGLFYANNGTNIHNKKHLLSLNPDIVFERWEKLDLGLLEG